MNPADCTRCGKCCLNMRQYMVVRSRSPDGRIPCTCVLSRETFSAGVSREDLHLMYDRNFSFRYPKACPFLAEEQEGFFTCIIYGSRPEHCRNFYCKNKKKEEEEKAG